MRKIYEKLLLCRAACRHGSDSFSGNGRARFEHPADFQRRLALRNVDINAYVPQQFPPNEGLSTYKYKNGIRAATEVECMSSRLTH
jgi:hypothetical protein